MTTAFKKIPEKICNFHIPNRFFRTRFKKLTISKRKLHWQKRVAFMKIKDVILQKEHRTYK